MDSRIHVFVCLALYFCLQSVEAWIGHVCSYTRYATAYRQTCGNSWCWSHVSVTYTSSSSYSNCCYGWSHDGNQNCNIPLCSPPCRNGGTCMARSNGAHTCQCRAQNAGNDCGGSTCSHVAPCFPGTCIAPDSCSCMPGFRTEPAGNKNRYCLKIDESMQRNLHIYQMEARLKYFPRGTTSASEKYFVFVDYSTNSTGFTWTRLREYNILQLNFTSSFDLQNLMYPPGYVYRSGFGIVGGRAEILHSKLPIHPSSSRTVVPVPVNNCSRSVSDTSPEQNIYVCDITQDFNVNLEHGDYLIVTFKTKGGGYRLLVDTTYNTIYNTQVYEGIERSQSIQFRFDFNPPIHCQETLSCTSNVTMLHVDDITKNSPLTIYWTGWIDQDSGMNHYAVEVFKLTKTVNNELEIKRDVALNPLFRQEINNITRTLLQYTPLEAGMYSIILEVADLANNTKYVRRLCLYDPHSQITVDSNLKLFVSSASEVGNYSYQSDVNGPITLQWNQHFRNQFQYDNALLGMVLGFPDITGDFPKEIPRALDDNDGPRTTNAIPNVYGIVNFKVAFAKDQTGGVNQPVPESGWINVYLNTTFNVPVNAADKDTITIWIKATDAMNNVQIDRTKVSLDSTPPEALNIQLLVNRTVPGIDFSSTFSLLAEDRESGIAYVEWIYNRNNGSIIYHAKNEGQRIESDTEDCGVHSKTCYCTTTLDCFYYDQSFSLSNCHLIVEKEHIDTEIITVTAVITNMAGRSTNKILSHIMLASLNGTKAYPPPQNINVKQTTVSSVVLTWDYPPSCSERSEVWVIVNGEKRAVHKDAQQFDITGLNPETTYTIYMQTVYKDGEMSDMQPFKVTTNEEESLSAGTIVGIVFGVIIAILLVLVIVVCVLRKMGYTLWKMEDSDC